MSVQYDPAGVGDRVGMLTDPSGSHQLAVMPGYRTLEGHPIRPTANASLVVKCCRGAGAWWL